MFNHGKMQRDFTYIDDIVEGVVRVARPRTEAEHGISTPPPDPAHSWAPYQVLNIGNSRPAGLLEYLDALGGSAGDESGAELPADAARRCAGNVCGYDIANHVDRTQARDADPRGSQAVCRLVYVRVSLAAAGTAA